MNRERVILLVVVLVVAAATPVGAVGGTEPGCTFPFSSTDATGTSVTIEEEPARVVTLNPSAAQTMWEIGAREKVVGLSSFASYLEGAETRTNIWGESAVNVEAVVDLEPDLVLAPNVIPDDTVAQLRNAGLTVYKFESAPSTEFIYEKTRLTGRLVGECEGANDRADRMQEDVETIREAVDGVDRPLVLYTLSGWTAGEGTFIDTIITTAGGRNLASEVGISGYREISEEVVLTENPEWIILNSDVPSVPDSPAYQQTDAVTEGNIIVVNGNYISQPAPRIVEAMKTIVQELHPEAYEAALEGTSSDRGNTGPPPSFSIAAGSIETDRVDLHETVTMSVNVTNTGGSGTFAARLWINGSLRDTKYVDVAADGTETVQLRHSFSSWGRHNVRVNDYELGTVMVVGSDRTGADATVDTEADSSGTPTATPTTTHPTTAGDVTDRPTTEPPTGTTPGQTPPEDSATTVTTMTATTADQATVQEPAGLPGFGIDVALLAIAVVIAMLLVRRPL